MCSKRLTNAAPTPTHACRRPFFAVTISFSMVHHAASASPHHSSTTYGQSSSTPPRTRSAARHLPCHHRPLTRAMCAHDREVSMSAELRMARICRATQCARRVLATECTAPVQKCAPPFAESSARARSTLCSTRLRKPLMKDRSSAVVVLTVHSFSHIAATKLVQRA
eukprot:IDg12779t1